MKCGYLMKCDLSELVSEDGVHLGHGGPPPLGHLLRLQRHLELDGAALVRPIRGEY